MSEGTDVLNPLRTWSHLASARRRPTEYEMVGTKLLWNTPNHELNWKFAGATPQIQWIIQNRNNSLLQHGAWDDFRDPDKLIYRTYCLMQDGQETFVDGVLDDYNENQHDLTLNSAWVDVLAELYTPARFLIHAVQMASSYLVALAPCGTIANAFMFQAGDQLRWVSRIAYRTMELAQSHPDAGFGADERAIWEKATPWRGFVELAERALVARDWGEAFAAVNLVLKPAIDEAFIVQLGKQARLQGDTLMATLLEAQLGDSKRAVRLTGELVRFLIEGRPENETVLNEWLEKWVPISDRAVHAYCSTLDPTGEAGCAASAATRETRMAMGLAL